jgi:hypothetical protein
METNSLIEKASRSRWTEKQAWDWYNSQPWLVGCNYVPRHAINQLEMWQAETFNPRQIDEELGWLAALGINSLRVFLHDLPWKQDAPGFLSRLERYLEIADRHKIGTMFVFFDSVWHPAPRLGPQPAPTPGVHNSFWVQSPGLEILRDETAFDALEEYVAGVVGHFRNDLRVQIWDLWNEPDNPNTSSYAALDLEREKKAETVLPLLAKTYQWARSARPSQPLTSGIWRPDEWTEGPMRPLQDLEKMQALASDIVSFHRYSPQAETRQSVEKLKEFGRPVICTEYLARGVGCTLQALLPYFKEERIGAYNWGAVSGKSQTIYPWSSLEKPFTEEPNPWHHDLLRPDGRPYDPVEAALIKSLTKGG